MMTSTERQEIMIPIRTFDVIARPVRFQVASIRKVSDASRDNASPILDVVDTSRPPGQPRYWFHPPGDIGPFQWIRTRRFGRGLDNFANICFLNATVQCLAYCTPFAQDCLDGRHTSGCLRRASNQVCGFCYFEQHIQNLLSPSVHKKSPASWPPALLQLLKREIRMNQGSWYGAQNCAHEWLVQFLDFLTKYDLPPELQKDFERGKIRNVELATCYLHQIFAGEFQERKTCKDCGKTSVRYDMNTCVRVLVTASTSLKKALQATFEPEELTGSNRPMCENCGVVRDKTASRLISQAPNVLVILVQRAEFRPVTVTGGKGGNSRYLPQIHKNSTRMHVPMTLDLSSFVSPDARENARKGPLLYDFLGSVNHAGSAGFGHYWAIIKGPDGMYHKVDDEYHNMVPESSLDNHLSSAYLVFYLRRRQEAYAEPQTASVVLYSGSATAPVREAACMSKQRHMTSAGNEEAGRVRLCVGLVLKDDDPVAARGQQQVPPTPAASMLFFHQPTSAMEGSTDPHETFSEQSTRLSPDNDDDADVSSLSSSNTLQCAEQYRIFGELTAPDVDSRPEKTVHYSDFTDTRFPLDPYAPIMQQWSQLLSLTRPPVHIFSRRLRRAITFAQVIASTLYELCSQRLKKRQRKSNDASMSSSQHVSLTAREFPGGFCPSSNPSSSPSLRRRRQSKFEVGKQMVAMNSLSVPYESDDGSAKRGSDVPTEIPAVSAHHTTKKARRCADDLKPEQRIAQAKSLKSQYGCSARPVDLWEDNDALHHVDPHVFEALQSELAPKTTRRSRHDKQYDAGKLKKVKKTKKEDFDFKTTVASVTQRSRTWGRHYGHRRQLRASRGRRLKR